MNLKENSESKKAMTDNVKIYGLLGYPLGHSLSAYMHNAAFKALRISAEYRLFAVAPHELASFLNSLSQQGIAGLNVTIPYKEEVLRHGFLETDSFFVEKTKAVNTIVKKDNKWKAFNTDAPGFLQDLKGRVDPSGKSIALLGAGGAAKAIAYTVAEAGARQIGIFDIDVKRGHGLVNSLKEVFPSLAVSFVSSVDELDISKRDILINATPVGMKKDDPCLVSERMLHEGLFVYDVVYNPAETKLLSLAKEAGAQTANGLGMLLNQGMLSFEIWTGQKAPKEVMWNALQSNLSSRQA